MLFPVKAITQGTPLRQHEPWRIKAGASAWLCCRKREYKGDALLQLEILQKCGLPVLVLKSAMDWDRAFVEAHCRTC